MRDIVLSVVGIFTERNMVFLKGKITLDGEEYGFVFSAAKNSKGEMINIVPKLVIIRLKEVKLCPKRRKNNFEKLSKKEIKMEKEIRIGEVGLHKAEIRFMLLGNIRNGELIYLNEMGIYALNVEPKKSWKLTTSNLLPNTPIFALNFRMGELFVSPVIKKHRVMVGILNITNDILRVGS